jgi:hypothetical protein
MCLFYLTNSSTYGDPINDRGKTMSKKYVPSNVCSSTSTLEGAGDMSCAMAIIPVRVKLKNKSQTIETYAFLDSGSRLFRNMLIFDGHFLLGKYLWHIYQVFHRKS